jgi:5-formyltetrahydrofolate cyclo-ligase
MTSPKQGSGEATAEKAASRIEAARRRDVLHAARGDGALDLVRLFTATWAPRVGTVVSAFWPFRSELDLQPLIHELHDRGCVVGLPVVIAKRTALAFRTWTPDTVLEDGSFGVLIPPSSAPEVDPDWLLVPLLAYDAHGCRLGYGGGFYDITLAALRARKSVFAIGVAYDGQEVERVPRGPDDARLDAILTEKRALIMEP